MFLEIPGGSFLMGDEHGSFDERPVHRVRVGAFLLARFPVTNREYALYLEATGAPMPRFWRDSRFNQADQPVVGVSWFDAVAYCRWLGERFGRTPRLPTEAEREWAARGGLAAPRYPWGDDEPALVGAWAPGSLGQDRPVPVSDVAPNGYGLCHMGDNVHEWCSDWWDPSYYASSPVGNPSGPPTGERRASRGGAWRHQLKFSRCSARSSLLPALRYNDYGFRVAAGGKDPRPTSISILDTTAGARGNQSTARGVLGANPFFGGPNAPMVRGRTRTPHGTGNVDSRVGRRLGDHDLGRSSV